MAQKVRRLEKRSEASTALVEANKTSTELLTMTRTRGGRYLTPQGMIALAVRRNLGNTSCADIGLVIMEDTIVYCVLYIHNRRE